MPCHPDSACTGAVQIYKMGVLGSSLHLASIIPLVLLLADLVKKPFVPASALVFILLPVTCAQTQNPRPVLPCSVSETPYLLDRMHAVPAALNAGSC